MSKQQIIKIVISVLIAALTALGAGLGLQSCTATRVVSTSASYVQHGDTTRPRRRTVGRNIIKDRPSGLTDRYTDRPLTLLDRFAVRQKTKPILNIQP